MAALRAFFEEGLYDTRAHRSPPARTDTELEAPEQGDRRSSTAEQQPLASTIQNPLHPDRECGLTILPKAIRKVPAVSYEAYEHRLQPLKSIIFDIPHSFTISDDRSVQHKIDEVNLHALRILQDPKKQQDHRTRSRNYVYASGRGRVIRGNVITGRRQEMENDPEYAGTGKPNAATAGVTEMFMPEGNQHNPKSEHKSAPSTALRNTKRPLIVHDSKGGPNAQMGSGNKHVSGNSASANTLAQNELKSARYNFDDLIDDLDLEELQSYSDRLQSRIQEKGGSGDTTPPCRYQVFYRIMSAVEEKGHQREPKRHLSQPFFDVPQWIRGQGTKGAFRCQVPVENLDLYLEKNKDVSFLVYRTFVEPTIQELEEHQRNHHRKPFIPTVNESIRPIHPGLLDNLTSMLMTRTEYADVLQHLRLLQELLAPYIFCYHHRSNIEDIANDLDKATGAQLILLLEYILDAQGHHYRSADALISQGMVSHMCVDYLFKPGDIVVFREREDQYTGWVATNWPRKQSAVRMSRREAEKQIKGGIAGYVDSSTSKGVLPKTDYVYLQSWTIEAWHWDFKGAFSRQHEVLRFHIMQEIDKTEDARIDSSTPSEAATQAIPITDLRVVPLRFCPEHIVQTLRRRGQTFWKCRERKVVSYQEENDQGFFADERYVVDLQTYESLHKASLVPQPRVNDLGDDAMKQEQCPEDPFELLLPLKIKGFNLRQKKWYDLIADRISDISWNKNAFSKIVMDPKAKEIVRALITKQIAAERSTDLIAGKGNGLILLLHGGPGTGKTLTAESVAEIAEKPLYRVTCGDVGTKAESVEKYLESVFHLGKLWGCVVLLDEADVFLEQRDLKDLERNALVSVFLRVLEYYEGILILTSNRVGTFDDAFRSRIQLALHYPTLNQYQRLRIWENFIDRLETFQDGAVSISDLKFHLEDLSRIEMNGREIRNAITTARQYAEYMNVTMNYEHLKDVIEISSRFDKYLVGLRGGFTEEEIKRDEGIR